MKKKIGYFLLYKKWDCNPTKGVIYKKKGPKLIFRS